MEHCLPLSLSTERFCDIQPWFLSAVSSISHEYPWTSMNKLTRFVLSTPQETLIATVWMTEWKNVPLNMALNMAYTHTVHIALRIYGLCRSFWLRSGLKSVTQQIICNLWNIQIWLVTSCQNYMSNHFLGVILVDIEGIHLLNAFFWWSHHILYM